VFLMVGGIFLDGCRYDAVERGPRRPRRTTKMHEGVKRLCVCFGRRYDTVERGPRRPRGITKMHEGVERLLRAVSSLCLGLSCQLTMHCRALQAEHTSFARAKDV
jgi:hypothetical protein